MRRASDLLGLPVVDVETGRQVGEIIELQLDMQARCLQGLVLSSGTLLAEKRVVPASRLHRIGADAVTMKNSQQAFSKRKPQGQDGFMSLEKVRKLTVFTRSGFRLGNVEDLVLEEGSVYGLELSDGMISDLVQGRTVVGLEEKTIIGEDTVIVEDYAAAGDYYPGYDSHELRE